MKFRAVAEKTAKGAMGLLYFAAPGRTNREELGQYLPKGNSGFTNARYHCGDPRRHRAEKEYIHLLADYIKLESGLKSIFAGLGLGLGKICNQI